MTSKKSYVAKSTKRLSKSIDFLSLLSDAVKGMTVLQEDLFNVTVTLPALKCVSESCTKIQNNFKQCLLNRQKFSSVLVGPDNKKEKIVLLNPALIKSMTDFSKSQIDIINAEQSEFIFHQVPFKYKDFSFDELMQFILPDHIEETVTSFETVGHIAHVNLKENLLQFKTIIGKMLLDKNQHIKTVVNKINSIDETFRFFKMELLAGEDNMNAKVQQHGCVYKFDFSKVYWNSRLQTEHQRIVDLVNEGDVVFDVFAGVGPFAIPAAKKKCVVHANDLNEHSFNALNENIKLNKVGSNVHTYNMDGRQFLNDVVIDSILNETHDEKSHKKTRKHVIMNLPMIAFQFLDVFRSHYDSFNIPLKTRADIVIHCYLFSKSKTPKLDAELIVGSAIGKNITEVASTHFVRRVAPNKVMMCTSFNLFWFERNAQTCTCYSDVSTGRKRVLEGGLNPLLVEKSRRLEDN